MLRPSPPSILPFQIPLLPPVIASGKDEITSTLIRGGGGGGVFH